MWKGVGLVFLVLLVEDDGVPFLGMGARLCGNVKDERALDLRRGPWVLHFESFEDLHGIIRRSTPHS